MRWIKQIRSYPKAILVAVPILALLGVGSLQRGGSWWHGPVDVPVGIAAEKAIRDIRWRGIWANEANAFELAVSKGKVDLSELIRSNGETRSVAWDGHAELPYDGRTNFIARLEASGSPGGWVGQPPRRMQMSHIGFVGTFEDGTSFAKLVALPPGWVSGQEIVVTFP